MLAWKSTARKWHCNDWRGNGKAMLGKAPEKCSVEKQWPRIALKCFASVMRSEVTLRQSVEGNAMVVHSREKYCGGVVST